MAEETITININQELIFNPLNAEPILIQIQQMEFGDAVFLNGQMSFSTTQMVFDKGCFHLDDEDFQPAWEAGLPIDVTLRLRQPLLKGYASIQDWMRDFIKERETTLRHSEAWYLTEATQKLEVPDVPGAYTSIGVRTAWAGPIV